MPEGWNVSAGQSFDTPLQLSATSHVLAAGRQTLVLFASVGQVALDPVQLSARSHAPADGRHTVLLGWNESAGQDVLEPVQVSATSQTPADGRQTVPALPAGCWQALSVPLH